MNSKATTQFAPCTSTPHHQEGMLFSREKISFKIMKTCIYIQFFVSCENFQKKWPGGNFKTIKAKQNIRNE